jgi:hypothetical protein
MFQWELKVEQLEMWKCKGAEKLDTVVKGL